MWPLFKTLDEAEAVAPGAPSRRLSETFGRRVSETITQRTQRNRRVSETITYSVSGGAFTSPYYSFSPSLPSTFEAGTTHVFTAGGISTSHPFRVGTARGATPVWITGITSGLTGTSANAITVAIPSDYTGNVVLYCNFHTSMELTKSVTVPIVNDTSDTRLPKQQNISN